MDMNCLGKMFLLFVICTFSYGLLPAQQANRTVHFGISVSPLYTTQQLSRNNLGESKGKVNFSGGVQVFYDLSARWQLVSGIEYSYIQVERTNYSLLFPEDVDSNGIALPKNSWITDNYRSHYIEIPLRFRFKIIPDEDHLYITTGGKVGFRLSYSYEGELVESGGPPRPTPVTLVAEPATVQASCMVGLGYEFALSEKLKMYFQPFAELSFSEYLSKGDVPATLFINSRLIHFGLTVGVRL